tara:strand:- start:1561 stop:2454 length:894 start_codon:yes stop_codon:yes gene_type:complete
MANDIRSGIKTKEEYIEGSSISYVPSILAIPKLKKYTLDIAKVTFKELSVENDSVVPSDLVSEMTEINAVKISGKSHTFLSYGRGNTLRKDLRSNGAVNIQAFHDQVLRQYNILFDQTGFFGEGQNAGLSSLTASNFLAPASVEIPAISGNGFNQILAAKQMGVRLNKLVNNNTASSDLTIYFYGDQLTTFLGNITEGQETDVRGNIQKAFAGKNVTFIEVSELAATPALLSAASLVNGIIIVSNDVTTLEHSGLPEIEDDGTNTEKKYYWSNYILGSAQVRPEILGGVIHQQVTFE